MRLTVCVTGRWAGVDSAWEQKKLKARKMLKNGDESHLPKRSEGVHYLGDCPGRFVGLCPCSSRQSEIVDYFGAPLAQSHVRRVRNCERGSRQDHQWRHREEQSRGDDATLLFELPIFCVSDSWVHLPLVYVL